MNLLAIDTSSQSSKVLIFNNNKSFQIEQKTPQKHTEYLFKLITKCLQKAKLNISDINGIAYINGPGNFTGIRIASTVCKSIAYALKLNIIEVSSTRLLAQEAFERSNNKNKIKTIQVAIDARMNEAYFAEYRIKNNRPILIEKIRLTSINQLTQNNLLTIYAGNAWSLKNLPTSDATGQLIYLQEIIANKDYNLTDALQSKPLYIRNNVVQKTNKANQ